MGQTDTDRIRSLEEQNTFISAALDQMMKEVDARVTGADCYPTITRTSGLISQIDYYADIARTQLRIRRTIGRTTYSGVAYITSMLTIFYNSDGTEDSRITTTINRDIVDITRPIESCDNVFSTTESICP